VPARHHPEDWGTCVEGPKPRNRLLPLHSLERASALSRGPEPLPRAYLFEGSCATVIPRLGLPRFFAILRPANEADSVRTSFRYLAGIRRENDAVAQFALSLALFSAHIGDCPCAKIRLCRWGPLGRFAHLPPKLTSSTVAP